jgi:hypothetical protein
MVMSKNLLRFDITLGDKQQEVKVFKGLKQLCTFIDTFGDNPITFTRVLGLHEYKFINGDLTLKKLTRTVNFIAKNKIDKDIKDKIITLDLETRTLDNIMIPYCISYFDGVKATSLYLSDYKDSDDMLATCITSLLQRKYNGYKIYVHNLSNFDGIFLLRILSNIDNFILIPVMKDGKIINLNISQRVNGRKYQVDIRDSLLMLPLSLRKLCSAFNIDSLDSKSIFPYAFVNNPNISLLYEGVVPSREFFSDISIQDYLGYSKGFSEESL